MKKYCTLAIENNAIIFNGMQRPMGVITESAL